MRVAVTGASGLIGSALTAVLQHQGHTVLPVSRRRGPGESVCWDPEEGRIEKPSLEGIDACVHLAGENIAARRWSAKQKTRILDSREKGTRLIAETMAQLRRRPAVLVSMSGVGYYGDRGDQVLTETSGVGMGFLPQVCQVWEAATEPARDAGIRTVILRAGMVLARHGGALARMLPLFRKGLGGVVGSGRQYWSWITLEDIVQVILFAMQNDRLQGAANAVAPEPVTNRQFTKTLGRVLGRPTVFPLPAFLARLALGQMAGELLLASARVHPQRLLEAGYPFRHPQLEGALRKILTEEA